MFKVGAVKYAARRNGKQLGGSIQPVYINGGRYVIRIPDSACRKLVAILVVLSLVPLSFISGCSSSTKSVKNVAEIVQPKEKSPFTLDYKLSDGNIKSFTQNDSINTLVASTPFYAGNQSLPSQKTSEYDKARAKKVEEIKNEAHTLVETSVSVKPKLEKVRKAYLSYLATVLKQEPKLEGFTKEAFAKISLTMSKEQITECEYNSIKPESITNPYAKSFNEYLKVTKAVQLGSLYLQDVNNVGALAAFSLEALGKSTNPAIMEANEELDKEMAQLDDLKKNLSSMIVSIGKIDYGFKQLNTGDYYMARTANNFMGSKMADLKAKAKALKPREGLTEQDIKFIQSYVAYFEKAQASFDDYLQSVDNKTLVPVDKTVVVPAGISAAYAADQGQDYANAYVSVTKSAEPPAPSQQGFFSKGWSAIKTAAHGVQTGVGVGIDTLGVAAKNISQVGCGLWYGNKPAEIWKDMKDNTKVIFDNYNNSVSGSSTLQTAGEYLEGVEKGAGQTAEGAVEGALGKGWTSWATGGIIKTTVGMFTGLGKGIYKVGNRNADTVTIVEGTLDIGLSFIGGSKVIIKGSQVPGLLKGLSQGGKLLGKDGLTFIKTAVANMDKQALKKEMAELLTKNKLTQAEVETLIKASIEYEAKEAVTASLKAIRADLVKQMTELLKKGGTEGLKASSEGIKQSLDDLLKASFEKNMGGFKQAMLKVMGETGTDYMDNLIGSWVDDYLKGVIKDVIEGAPSPEEVSGTWNGSYTITDILLSSDDAKAEGCDFAELNKLKGKSSPLSLQLTVGANGAGTSKFSSGSGDPQTMSANYTGGHVVVNKNQDGMQLHLEGDAKRTDAGYAIDGPMTASVKGKPLFRGTWHVTKSK